MTVHTYEFADDAPDVDSGAREMGSSRVTWGAMGSKDQRSSVAWLEAPGVTPVGGVRILPDPNDPRNVWIWLLDADGNDTPVTPPGFARVERDLNDGAVVVMWGQP